MPFDLDLQVCRAGDFSALFSRQLNEAPKSLAVNRWFPAAAGCEIWIWPMDADDPIRLVSSRLGASS